MQSDESPSAGPGPRPPEHRLRLLVTGVIGVVVLLVVVVVAIQRERDRDAGAEVATADAPSSTAATEPSTSADPSSTTEERPTTTKAPGAKGPGEITLAFAGDLLPHSPLVAQAKAYGQDSGKGYDFGPMLEPMAPVISKADVAICHMETPVAPPGTEPSGYPAFGSPPELVDAIAGVGYDGCSTASNHSLDRGTAGIAATLDRFDADGLQHAGTARSAEEGASVTMYDVDGAKVAHLSYAYGFNGYTIPSDAPFAANQIDVERIHRDATAARQAGAQLVVVSLHWGTEYHHDPDQYQRDIAAALLPYADIDVVIGHHAHVVQPIEKVEGTYVVWGLGNQLANQPEEGRADGLTVVLHASKGEGGRYSVASIDAVPTYVEAGTTFRVWPIVRSLKDSETPADLRPILEASYDRTAAVLATTPTDGVNLPARP